MAMSPDEIRRIRFDLGLTQAELAQVLGYGGNMASAAVIACNYETGARELSTAQERLLVMYDRFGLPSAFTPDRAKERFRRR